MSNIGNGDSIAGGTYNTLDGEDIVRGAYSTRHEPALIMSNTSRYDVIAKLRSLSN